MPILFLILVALGAIVLFWLIFRLLGGCLLRLLIGLGVLVLVGVLVFLILRR